MKTVTVAFFNTMDIQSKTRSVVISNAAFPQLLPSIANLMRKDEFFACFRDATGSVVALDKDGISVRV